MGLLFKFQLPSKTVKKTKLFGNIEKAEIFVQHQFKIKFISFISCNSKLNNCGYMEYLRKYVYSYFWVII